MNDPRAVLFDFDGVLADTENVHVVAWERVFHDMGWAVEPEVCARAAEEDDRAFLSGLFSDRGLDDGDVDGWVGRKQAITKAVLADAPRLYPGAAQLIRSLSGRSRLAVVSTTWRENITDVLATSGLLEAFELIVGKEDVESVKPDPEAYRTALARLGIAPGDAVALEDSPGGLASAEAAGVRVVVVGHHRPHGDWVGEATYLANLSDLDAVLQALGVR